MTVKTIEKYVPKSILSTSWWDSFQHSVYKTGTLEYTNNQIYPGGKWNDPEALYVEARNHLQLQITTNSTSSPGLFVKKILLAPRKPKKPPKPPSAPRFNPPKLPVRAIKRGKTPHALKQAEKRFAEAYDRALKARKHYIEKFNIAYARYQEKVVAYNKMLANRKVPKPRYKKVQMKSPIRPNNYYKRTTVLSHGFEGYIYDRTYCSLSSSYQPPYYPSVDMIKNGPHIYKMKCLVGYLGYDRISAMDNSEPLRLGQYSNLTDLTNRAVARAKSKIFEKMSAQKVHVGNIIAERHQTFQLLNSIIKTLAGLLTNKGRVELLKNFTPDLDSLAKGASNHYLAFMFGAKPLINDFYGAVEEAARLSQGVKDRIVVRAVAELSDEQIESMQQWHYLDEHKVFVSVKVSYVLEFKISNAALDALKNFGLLNPFEIAWEAMPWSFVADWFIPIGNYIQALSSDAGLEFVTGTEVITTRTTRESSRAYNGKWIASNEASDNRQVLGYAKGSDFTEIKERKVLTTCPTPSLPEFKNPFTDTHFFESLALLTQRLRSH